MCSSSGTYRPFVASMVISRMLVAILRFSTSISGSGHRKKSFRESQLPILVRWTDVDCDSRCKMMFANRSLSSTESGQSFTKIGVEKTFLILSISDHLCCKEIRPLLRGLNTRCCDNSHVITGIIDRIEALRDAFSYVCSPAIDAGIGIPAEKKLFATEFGNGGPKKPEH